MSVNPIQEKTEREGRCQEVVESGDYLKILKTLGFSGNYLFICRK
jgi:hypothetical protein